MHSNQKHHQIQIYKKNSINPLTFKGNNQESNQQKHQQLLKEYIQKRLSYSNTTFLTSNYNNGDPSTYLSFSFSPISKQAIIIESKKQFYGREQAQNMIEEEKNRRILDQQVQYDNYLERQKLLGQDHQQMVQEIQALNQNHKQQFIFQQEDEDLQKYYFEKIRQLEENYKQQLQVQLIQQKEEISEIQDQQQQQYINLEMKKGEMVKIAENDYIENNHIQNQNLQFELQVITDNNQHDNQQQNQQFELEMQNQDYDTAFEETNIFNPTQKTQTFQSIPFEQNIHNNYLNISTQNLPSSKSSIPQSARKNTNSNNQQNQIQEGFQKDYDNETLVQNLKSDIREILQNSSQTKNKNTKNLNLKIVQDSDRVEDMILELNRLTQKSRGLIPAQSQQKIQQFASQIEMEKMTYKNKQLLSPVRQTRLLNANSPKSNSKVRQEPNLNVNSKKLKEIILNTESKIKRTLRGFNQRNSSSKRNSLARESPSLQQNNLEQTLQSQRYDMQDTQSFTNVDLNSQTQEISINDRLQEALSDMNARYLSQFLRNKNLSQQLQSNGDLELGYILLLVVSLVDDRIRLNNDKSDVLQKKWDDIVRQLSNHGGVVNSLMKFRIFLSQQNQTTKYNQNMQFKLNIQKLQIIKKYEERQHLFERTSQFSQPIKTFLQRMIYIFKELKNQGKESKQQLQDSATKNKQKGKLDSVTSPIKFYINNNSSANFSNQKQSNQNSIKSPSKMYALSPKATSTLSYQSNLNQQTPLSYRSNKNHLQSQTFSINDKLLDTKKQAIIQSYDLQLQQAKSLRDQEQEARARELEIAKLKLLKSQIIAEAEREDRKRNRERELERERQHVQRQGEFISTLVRPDRNQVESEKKKQRELSIENTEFKRQVKNANKEEELQYNRELNEKSLQDHLWKEQVQREKLDKTIEVYQQKSKEILIDKVRKSEQFLLTKEQEVDERLKSQFENAAYRFNLLDQTQNALRKEIQQLQEKLKTKQFKK